MSLCFYWLSLKTTKPGYYISTRLFLQPMQTRKQKQYLPLGEHLASNWKSDSGHLRKHFSQFLTKGHAKTNNNKQNSRLRVKQDICISILVCKTTKTGSRGLWGVISRFPYTFTESTTNPAAIKQTPHIHHSHMLNLKKWSSTSPRGWEVFAESSISACIHSSTPKWSKISKCSLQDIPSSQDSNYREFIDQNLHSELHSNELETMESGK